MVAADIRAARIGLEEGIVPEEDIDSLVVPAGHSCVVVDRRIAAGPVVDIRRQVPGNHRYRRRSLGSTFSVGFVIYEVLDSG